MGFLVHDVPHDGQCAFACISHQLRVKKFIQADITGEDVRRDLVSYLSTHDELKQVISNRLIDKSIEQYISEMSEKAEWADENMLYIASAFYDVNIRVIRTDSSPPSEYGSSSEDRLVLLGYVSCIAGELPTHYVSLLPCAGQKLIHIN